MRRGDLYVLSLSHLTDDVYQGALPAMLPFLVSDRGVSVAAASMLVFVANLTSSIGQPYYGRLADRGRAWWLPAFGLALAGIGLGFAGVVPGYWWICVAVGVSGIGVDIFHPGSARAAHFVAKDSATRYSVFTLGGSVGFAIGPLLAAPLMVVFGLPGMMFLAIPAVLVAGLLATRLPRSVSRGASQAQPSGPDQWGAFGRLTAAVIIRSAAFFSITAFLPLWWVVDLHHSKAAGDYAVTAYMAAGVVGTYLGGRLADRFGHRAVALCGFLAATPLTLLYLLFPGAVFLLLPAGVALYLPFGILVGLGQRYLPARPGLAGGVTLGLSASVGGLAAPLFGLLSTHAGLLPVLVVSALLPLAAAALTRTLPVSAAAGGGPVQRPAERGERAQRQQPPRVHPAKMHQQRRHGQGDHHDKGDLPVIADDEVIPERAERLQPPHDTVTFS
jgi:FSR family fosmidomycin resistance protein-like MFS transporter